MQQEEKELRLNQLKLIVLVTTLIFAFMLVYTIYWLVDYNKQYGFFEKTIAKVVEHQEIDGADYDLLSFVVDGNEYRVTTEYESKNDIGDKVKVFYDKNCERVAKSSIVSFSARTVLSRPASSSAWQWWCVFWGLTSFSRD